MTSNTQDQWAQWLLHRRFGGDLQRGQAMLQELAVWRDRILEHAIVAEGETVLDVGCGDGLIAFGVLDRVGEEGVVIFSDISQDLLDHCRSLAEQMQALARCRFVRAPADDLAALAPGSVDVVTTRSVLIYVQAKQQALHEFFRVLRPGGRLSIFEPINRFCYRHPGLGLKVQSVLHDLHLVAEAILPHFNRYSGAEAIASSAALYLCRPTRRSLPAAQSLKVDPRIYTQGMSAEETTMTVLPQGVVDTVKRLLAAQTPARVLLVGDGWPTDLASTRETISLRGYLRTLSTHRQGTRSPYAGTVAVNLFPYYHASLVRVLLLSAAKQLLIVVADHVVDSILSTNKDDPLRTLIDSSYQLVARERGKAKQPGVVLLQRRGPQDADAVKYLLRYLIDHPQARLVNAWREALIAWETDQGRRLSKNQARQLIERQQLSLIHAHSYLSELPLSGLRTLIRAVEQTLAALDQGNHSEEPE